MDVPESRDAVLSDPDMEGERRCAERDDTSNDATGGAGEVADDTAECGDECEQSARNGKADGGDSEEGG